MPPLDFDALKWIIGTLGVAGGWGFDRYQKRSKLAKAKADAETALAKSEQAVDALEETVATKNREIEQLRAINDELRGALALSGREAHG